MSRRKVFSMQVEGLRELEAQLKEIGALASVKIVGKDARKAMKPILEQIRARAPVDTGLTRDSLALKTVKPRNGSQSLHVGVVVRVGKGGGRGDKKKALEGKKGEARKTAQKEWIRRSAHWRWHFTEKGTSTQPARPFIRPAFDQNASGAVITFRDELRKDFKRLARKHARDAKKAATQ